MSHITPAFDGNQPAAPAPATTRTVIDDYEAWVDHVWDYYVAAADTGQTFTIDQVARKHHLPDPPRPQYQWGSLPGRLYYAGIISHHGAAGSVRAHHSLVHEWIGVPANLREATARARREARTAARAERKAAA